MNAFNQDGRSQGAWVEYIDILSHLEHYSNERNGLFVDRTEKHSEFKLTLRNHYQ